MIFVLNYAGRLQRIRRRNGVLLDEMQNHQNQQRHNKDQETDRSEQNQQ